MSDKGRAYSDSAVTIIFKGSSMAEVQGHIDDANSLAGELREVHAECSRKAKEIEDLNALIVSLRLNIESLK